jgi:hypothetical protein
VVEELDSAGTAVPHGLGEPFGGSLELVCLRGGQQRRGGLLDHLLVAPLYRTVPYAQRPGGAVAVGDHLHLDMASAGDQTLQEHHVVAEGPPGFVTRALVGIAQLGLALDHPNSPATAARGCLEHQRVPDDGRLLHRGVEGIDRPPAPRGDRNAHLLGEELRTDLVPEFAHRLGRRADEGDAQPMTQLGEVRVLGDEPPPDPHRVGLRRQERDLEQVVVQVRPACSGAQRIRDVGFADEHGGRLGVRVQRDRSDGRGIGVLGIQIPHGVDQPHCGLPAVHDRDPAEVGTFRSCVARHHPLSLPCPTTY